MVERCTSQTSSGKTCPATSTTTGSDGVKNMIELTLMAIPDCKFTHHGGMKNGNSLRRRVDDVRHHLRPGVRLPWCIGR